VLIIDIDLARTIPSKSPAEKTWSSLGRVSALLDLASARKS
jgi:hypothetical protein